MTILLMTLFVFCFGFGAGIVYCGWWRNRQVKIDLSSDESAERTLIDGETY